MRHDATAIDFERHARRRIEGSLQPLEHELRVEPLIGLEMRLDPRRIDPRLAEELERVDGERVTQA